MSLRERLAELAEFTPRMFGDAEHDRDLALAAARMALDEAARECDRVKVGAREDKAYAEALACEECADAIHRIAATLGAG